MGPQLKLMLHVRLICTGFTNTSLLIDGLKDVSKVFFVTILHILAFCLILKLDYTDNNYTYKVFWQKEDSDFI